MSTFTVTPEELATIVTKGIASDLETMIKKRLTEHVDPIISQLARDLAKELAVKVQSYHSSVSAQDPFGPRVQLVLQFNGENVHYVQVGE